MIKVPDVVENIIKNNDIALEALRADLLNISAYAQTIKKQVEEVAFKPVKKGTIAMAISRLSRKILKNTPQMKPNITISHIRVNEPFCLLAWDKTFDVQRKLSTLYPFVVSANDLPAITGGLSEILLFCLEEAKEKVLKHFVIKPKEVVDNLVGISVQFSSDYLETPNIFYALFAALATKRINVIEVVSSRTELTFFVRKTDMEETVKALNVYSKK